MKTPHNDAGQKGFIDSSDFSELEQVERAFASLSEVANDSAKKIEERFQQAAKSLSIDLIKAAQDGEISLKEVLGVIEKIILTLGQINQQGSLTQALNALGAQTGQGAFFGGARANGGFAAAGSSYLVGENGPEVFRPQASGQIEPLSTDRAMSIHFHVNDTAQGLLRSQAQISALLRRGVSAGLR